MGANLCIFRATRRLVAAVSHSVYYCWHGFNHLTSPFIHRRNEGGWVSILSNKCHFKMKTQTQQAGFCCRWCLFICMAEIIGCFLGKWLIVLAIDSTSGGSKELWELGSSLIFRTEWWQCAANRLKKVKESGGVETHDAQSKWSEEPSDRDQRLIIFVKMSIVLHQF